MTAKGECVGNVADLVRAFIFSFSILFEYGVLSDEDIEKQNFNPNLTCFSNFYCAQLIFL